MSYLKNYRWMMLLTVSVSLILVPVFSYAGKPPAPAPNIFIEASTLNSWIQNGYNNGVPDSNGYSQMVVISATTSAVYAAGHPTGSYLWDYNTEMRTTRSDGVLPTSQGVLTKPMMNAFFSKTGIDGAKVVVLISDDWMHMGSAYYDLRYWGIPKKQLKVVNGLIKDYKTAGYAWDTNTPAPAGGTYSVCNLDQSTSIDEVRAPLQEMMSVAKDNDANTVILDVRNLNEYNGENATSDTSFSGRIRTAVLATYTDMITNGSSNAAGAKIKSAADLKTYLEAKGASSAKQHYVHCRTSIRAGVGFLAIDAMLGWKVKKFEGSWIVWGNLSDEEGILASDSPWRTNKPEYSEVINASVSTNKSQTIPGYGITVGCSYAKLANRTNANDKQICGSNSSACISVDPCVPFEGCTQTYDCKFNPQ